MDLGDIMIALTIIAGIGLLWLLKILVYDRIKARWEQYKANQALLATVTKPYLFGSSV